MGRLSPVAVLGVEAVDRYDGSLSAALRGPVVIAAIGQVVLAGGPQEGAEPALRAIEIRQITPLQQVGEEALDDILGLMRRTAAATDEGVEGEPVIAAQFLKRSASRGIRWPAYACDAAPLGRRETGG